MRPGDEIVSELTRLVWNTVLGLDVEETVASEGGEIVTSVDISGAWEGTISISFPSPLARRVAAAMLACAEDEATSAEIRDVVGELANMIGGNVKGVLPGPCKLSLPRVETNGSIPAGVSSHQYFECAGQTFSVTVTERVSKVRADA